MKIKILKALRFIIIILIIYTLISGYFTFFRGGAIDFPCFVTYDEKNNCIQVKENTRENKKTSPRIEAFFTVYSAGWQGGGCYYESSETNFLEIKTSGIKLRLEKINGDLKVNNTILKKNEEFKITKVFTFDPWSIFRLIFENLGLVSNCPVEELKISPLRETIVIVGSYGTEISFIKGFLILLTLALGVIFINRYLKKIEVPQPKNST